jgi:glycosyltransferase involved in cell wall biosynthesis
MTLGIVIPTYRRSDNTSLSYLHRALSSVKSQTYQDYKVFLIGDRYDDDDEFTHISETVIDRQKIYYENLTEAKERDKYKIGSKELWCSGGVNAYNHGIKVATSQNIEWICHLDHDDWWDSDHLQNIADVISRVPNLGFVYSCSRHIKGYLPYVNLDNQVISSYPVPCNVIHSSVCINHKKIPLLYRDVFSEAGIVQEADIDMWYRITKYMQDNQLESALIKKITCHHIEEQR